MALNRAWKTEMHSCITLVLIFSQLFLLTDFGYMVDPSCKHPHVLVQEGHAEMWRSLLL